MNKWVVMWAGVGEAMRNVSWAGMSLVLMLGCSSPTPAPKVPAALVKVDGDALTAPLGQSVAVAPVVQVVDSDQRGIAGVSVHWAVTAGDGSIVQAETKTDADGKASCGGWRLGPSRGLNLLEASVVELAPVSFAAVGIRSSTLVQVVIVVPASGLVPSLTTVGANATTSQYVLGSVVASLEGATVPLTEAEGVTCRQFHTEPCYKRGGTLDLSQQPRDVPMTLFVTATDAMGNVGEAAVVVTRNDPPTVTVSSPIEGTLANPFVQIAASCSDDGPGGCVSLKASLMLGASRVELAAGTTGLMDQLALSGWEGTSPQLDFEGTDALGQVTKVSRAVQVNSSPGLTLKATVPGIAIDVLGSRVLYVEGSELRIFDTSSHADVLVLDEPAFCPVPVDSSKPRGQAEWCRSFLTPKGAVYLLSPRAGVYAGVYDWRDGIAIRVGAQGTRSIPRLLAAGNFALFSSDDGGMDGADADMLILRDLDAGSDSELGRTIPAEAMDLSSTGDVLFTLWDESGSSVSRWHAGMTTTVSPSVDAGVRRHYLNPMIDQNLTAWLVCDSNVCSSLTIDDGSTQLSVPAVNAPTAISNGWLGYGRVDSAGLGQVWRHGPGGESQATFFNRHSLVERIGPDGQIIFMRWRTDLDPFDRPWTRFRVAVGGAPQSLGGASGRVVLRDGKLFILSGPNVIEIGP